MELCHFAVIRMSQGRFNLDQYSIFNNNLEFFKNIFFFILIIYLDLFLTGRENIDDVCCELKERNDTY